jgi:transposase
MSDAEWAVIEPTLPTPAWLAGKGGRPARRCRRDYVNAIRYLVKEGIQWRAMPADLPHWRTVYDVADGWQKSGATEAMHHQLRRARRIAAGREPEPTAAVIDSQSVKASEEVCRASRGYDAGKKVTAVIFSLAFGHVFDLQRCVEDSVVDGPGEVPVQHGPTIFGEFLFGVSWLPLWPSTSAARRSPSARASASRSCQLSASSRRMRLVAASNRRSSEGSEARWR